MPLISVLILYVSRYEPVESSWKKEKENKKTCFQVYSELKLRNFHF
jgi:hypothetical protein